MARPPSTLQRSTPTPLRPSGPALGSRRGSGSVVRWLKQGGLIALLVGGGLYLGYTVIGHDLHQGTHLAATHADTAGGSAQLPASAVAQAGDKPVAARGVVAAVAPLAVPAHTADPVAIALLSAARDHLARKVAPAVYSVEDLRANAGNHCDLIERGLDGLLPLRTALVRHRARNPQLYGLAAKPALTLDERKRAWNGDNVEVFLRAFAVLRPQNEPEAGDIAVLVRTKGPPRKLLAVVTDVTDDAGHAQFIVLDPADKAAREVSTKAGYQVQAVYTLGQAQVTKIRQVLDLSSAPAGQAL